MHLIIYGPEGSGKGTQAKRLADLLQLPVYTSGDLVREAAQHDSGLIGEACRKALETGTYVGDSEMFVLWKNKLKSKEAHKGFILDGFPRNVRQAKFLLRKMAKYNYPIDRFIYLMLSDEEATKRLLSRHRSMFGGSGENHDTPERIAQRLFTYRKQEKELVKFFKELDKVLEINGNQTPDAVFAEIRSGLNVSDQAHT